MVVWLTNVRPLVRGAIIRTLELDVHLDGNQVERLRMRHSVKAI